MELFTPENIAALLTLTGLELVLGIDNIVFIIVVTANMAFSLCVEMLNLRIRKSSQEANS